MGQLLYGTATFGLFCPTQNHASGYVLCVNITTPGGICDDNECFLTRTDYGWIKPNHRSVVAFSRSKVYAVDKLEQAISCGALRQPTPDCVPAKTVSIVAIKAKISDQISEEKKHLLRSN